MPPIGFCLISTGASKEHAVYSELEKVKEITELHHLQKENSGDYNMIAKIEVEGEKPFYRIGQLVVDEIRTIPGVIDTKTLTGIKF